ncbi:MAG: helix-turn-helix domain-containing protein [Mangrovibacterium sp.]
MITPLTWQENFKEELRAISIDDDFILFDKMEMFPAFDYPFRMDVTTAMIVTKGWIKGRYNLQKYTAQAPCFVIVLPQQILEYEAVSKDFEGLFVVMSERFTSQISLGLQNSVSLMLSTQKNHVVRLSEVELRTMKRFYGMFHSIVSDTSNPNRFEIVKHLTLAFFYHSGARLAKEVAEEPQVSKQELLLQRFLELLHFNFKTERNADFYADKLCLTPKYLTTVIRQTSGKTVGQWIDDHVMLEARALLKSSRLSIQQISDELNFPTQSYFGRYFKRHEGRSPKEYREK